MFLDPIKAILAAVVLMRVGSNDANDADGDSSTMIEQDTFQVRQAKVHTHTHTHTHTHRADRSGPFVHLFSS